tara:strand:+ start:2887 stop:4023 length:1137 start_codon:yes stop_codon:yes gene_type:complete
METNTDSNVKNWDDLELKTELLRGIYSLGFEKPSEIQQKAILPITKGKDVIAQAQSGTGKTGAFSISALQNIDIEKKECQAIIISSTRELVMQIHGVVNSLGEFMDGLNTKLLVGGTSVADDIQSLQKCIPHIVVGTPGRIFDMIRRRKLDVFTANLFVLDEADELLSYGFKDQIHSIFQYFNDEIQTAIFSATMPDEVIELTDKFMNDPYKIIMKPHELSLDGIQQCYIATINDDEKYNWLKSLYDRISLAQSIIFVNDVNRVIDLYQAMKKDGFPVCHIHSGLTKDERDTVIREFKSGTYNVLISSNITARGIDIQTVNTVINFDIPRDVNTYLHRIGRSGRWGRKGQAINFVSQRDIGTMKRIEGHYDITIEEYK